MANGLTRLDKLVTVAELATRAARAARALRNAGNPTAASELQAECDRACKQIVKAASNRRRAASRARAARM